MAEKKETNDEWMKRKRREKEAAMKEVPDYYPTKSDLPEIPDDPLSHVISDIIEGEIRRRTGVDKRKKETYGVERSSSHAKTKK